MKTRIYVEASTLIFMLMLVGHLVRLMEGWPVLVGSFSLPMWASILAILVIAGLAAWGFLLLLKPA